MGRIVFESKKFKLLETHRNYVVKRKDDLYNHAHFKRRDHAIEFIKFLEKGILPRSMYWKKAAERVLTKEELEKCIEQKTKDRFRNSHVKR